MLPLKGKRMAGVCPTFEVVSQRNAIGCCLLVCCVMHCKVADPTFSLF